MLDGLRYVIAQIALIVAVTALLASILGWLLGRASGTRRAKKAAAAGSTSRLTPATVQSAPSSPPRHALEATGAVPTSVEETVAPVVTPSIVDTAEPVAAPAVAESSAPQYLEPPSPVVDPIVQPSSPVVDPIVQPSSPVVDPIAEPSSPVVDPIAEPIVEALTTDPPADLSGADAAKDEHPDEDPDRTVLRPAPGMTSTSRTQGRISTSGTPLYTPPRFTMATPMVTPVTNESQSTVGRPVSVHEVQELRRELRAKELELGKLEAGALSAWDRTVPHLETQISDLLDENASLRRQIRDGEEHSDADAKTVERLRSMVAERDSRLAEIRAQS